MPWSSSLADMGLPEWSFAFGGPVATGQLRVVPEDFVVEEDLGFLPDGSGEHLFLQVRKRDANTEWVARAIARWAEVRPSEVSYAGLKDRRAVTTQWFSVSLSGRDDPEPEALGIDGAEVIAMARNSRKLRRGALRGNRFQLRIRELVGARSEIETRLATIVEQGVPNYFGPQRFGRGGNNLLKAEALFKGEWRERDRHKRGIYLSAARSFLFNRVLSTRVEARSWNTLLPGECVMLDGSGSFFRAESIDGTLLRRLQGGDIHPSGPLWGRGSELCADEVAALEQAVVAEEPTLRLGLEAEGLRQERRPLRLPVRDLRWEFEEASSLMMHFSLPAGSYATAVLREVASASEALD